MATALPSRGRLYILARVGVEDLYRNARFGLQRERVPVPWILNAPPRWSFAIEPPPIKRFLTLWSPRYWIVQQPSAQRLHIFASYSTPLQRAVPGTKPGE